MGVLIHGLAMGIFLGMGYLLPRDKQLPLLNRDLFVNVATGLAIFLIAKPAMDFVSDHFGLQLFTLPFTSSWLQLLVAFLLLDFFRYWLHYAHHRFSWLWFFHRVHHSAEHLDATTGLRMHIVDFIQLAMIPILLFGVLLDTTGFADWVIPTALAFGVFFDAFVHANLQFDPAKPFWRVWGKVLNNPHFHVWHHTREGPDIYGNYGNVLVVWDQMFGTVITKPELPPALGISADQAIKNDPLNLQLLTPRS